MFDNIIQAVEYANSKGHVQINKHDNQEDAIDDNKASFIDDTDKAEAKMSPDVSEENEATSPKVVNMKKCTPVKLENTVFQRFRPSDDVKNEICEQIRQQHLGRRTQFHFCYYEIGSFVIIVARFFNSSQQDYWCFKPEAVTTCMARNDKNIPIHPALQVFQTFTLRRVANGPDEPMTRKNKKRGTFLK